MANQKTDKSQTQEGRGEGADRWRDQRHRMIRVQGTKECHLQATCSPYTTRQVLQTELGGRWPQASNISNCPASYSPDRTCAKGKGSDPLWCDRGGGEGHVWVRTGLPSADDVDTGRKIGGGHRIRKGWEGRVCMALLSPPRFQH